MTMTSDNVTRTSPVETSYEHARCRDRVDVEELSKPELYIQKVYMTTSVTTSSLNLNTDTDMDIWRTSVADR